MIRSRQAKLVTNHEPEASLVFYMLQHVFEKTIILLGTETPCNRLVKTLGLYAFVHIYLQLMRVNLPCLRYDVHNP